MPKRAAAVGVDTGGPYKALPPGLPDRLRPYVPEIAEEVVRAIRTGIPEYARPMDDTYMQAVHRGVDHALHGLLERMAQPDTDWEPVRATYERIGRGEAEEGRSLDSFQSALRLGARVTWRRVNALVDEGLLPRHVLGAFGEVLFLHLDEMAAAATAAYTEARLHAAGELQQRRARLVDLLTADPPASAEAIADLAHAARWTVPRAVAVVAVDPGPGAGPIVPPEFLTRFDVQPALLVVPDPEGPGRARAVAGALQGLRAAMGPTVALDEGARSLRWATEALDLVRRGVLSGTDPAGSVVRCQDHLTTLLLLRDDALLDAMAERRLRPLAQVRPPQRERLAETLLCWLRSGRGVAEVAARLAVHPQTVRYRMRQLDELFGDLLHDPEARFEIQLALRARELRGGAAAGRAAPE
ncbi:DNA-binding CsgD family transcriptional regulator [Streptomyces griseochromogenes]|uniref:DNA-binding CsgD family transcriptional regulator n=1 Tax=Streptomyces griseochromogenes TaxID=68214 RepID=A0ABS4LRY6_9ACTN|nr:helix-turn-helix domain-containing protein [Streptomyces griseochromogenes]MBP2050175.1 DNA-binding CsgD family transcriptional regulator [Streptomyces griseochromogenes]